MFLELKQVLEIISLQKTSHTFSKNDFMTGDTSALILTR